MVPICAIDRVAPGSDAPDTFPGGLSLSAQSILPFGSGPCAAKTLAGLADGCVDMGDARFEPAGPGGRPVPGGTFEYLPAARLLAGPPPARAAQRANELRGSLRRLHHLAGDGCLGGVSHGAPLNSSRIYYVEELALIGFGAALEMLLVELVSAHHFGRQLVLGYSSSPEWAPRSFCGEQRSLACYFSFSSCCVAPAVGVACAAETLSEADVYRRRRVRGRSAPGGARLLGLPGYNEYGSIFVYAQAAAHAFDSLTPHARREVWL